jgi:1-phosphofructokinase
MLGQHGIHADFVPVAGESRVNLKIIDPIAGVETEINEPGFAVTPAAVAMLEARLHALAREASVMVFSGSLPPGAPVDLYSRLLAVAHAEGVRTTLDTVGGALARGLAAGPDLVKPNRAEVEELLDAPITDERSLVTAAHRILGMGARRVVISLGPDGAISASADGTWRARVPAVISRSTVGAGDAMMAALAYGLVQSLSQPEALRLATAAVCAAVVAVERYLSSSDIHTLLPQILIEPVPLMPIGARQGTR